MSENLRMIQELNVSPKKIRAKTGSFQVTVSNREDRTNEYRLSAEDPDNVCTYSFDTDTVTVEAGATVTVTLTVSFKGVLPTGTPRICNFTVSATKATGEVETAQGQLERPAFLPIWALVGGGVAVVAIIAIIIALAGGGDGTATPTLTLTMAVNGSGSTTPVAGAHQHSEGDVVDITATAASGWQFDGWTGDVANSGSTNTTVTMDASKTVTANFSEIPPEVVTVTLTMAVNGSGSTTPAVGTHQYPEGDMVNITATADDGWQFDGWIGAVAESNSASTTVTMDASKTVTANFSEAPLNLSGVWRLDVSNIDSSCGPEGDWSSTVTVVQDGDALETTGIKGSTFIVAGSIDGDTVTIGPGAFPDSGGTTTATYTMTIISDTLMEGTEIWTWTDGVDTCVGGTATITFTRID